MIHNTSITNTTYIGNIRMQQKKDENETTNDKRVLIFSSFLFYHFLADDIAETHEESSIDFIAIVPRI